MCLETSEGLVLLRSDLDRVFYLPALRLGLLVFQIANEMLRNKLLKIYYGESL